MLLFILRWGWLFSALGAAFLLTQSITPYSWFAALAFVSITGSIYTVYVKRTIKWSLLSYMLTPLLIWASSLSLLIFMDGAIQRFSIIAIAFALSWAWSTTLEKQDDARYLGIFRGNLLSYINSFIIFFSASSLFGADTFLSFSKWQALAIIFLFSTLLHLQTLRASHVAFRDAYLFSLVAGLLILEIFGVLLFWPSSFLVNGILVTVMFYILTGVSRCIVTSVLSRKLIGKYLMWGMVMIFAIMVTADWQ